MGFVGSFDLSFSFTESFWLIITILYIPKQHATEDFCEKNNEEGIVDSIDKNDLKHLGSIHVGLCVMGDSIFSFIKYVMSPVGLEF